MGRRYKGLTWDHPRGYQALRAAAVEIAPSQGLEIEWDIQPLEGFESHPIADLCARYDLLVLDHPHIGDAVAAAGLQPLEAFFPASELATLDADSIGPSLRSYRHGGRTWALPLDAASQVTAYRPDLLSSPPRTWAEVETIAEEGGLALSLAGPHAILSVLSICAALDPANAGRASPDLFEDAIGARAVGMLQRLFERANQTLLAENPIGILEHMARRDDVRLCPLVYGYVNYARAAADRAALAFSNAPSATPDGVPGSTLGGTGIGLTARADVSSELLAHLRWLMSDRAQAAFIPDHVGQPSRRSAWQSQIVNRQWGDFYSRTASTLETAYVRPRYQGYIAWQSLASAFVREAFACRLEPGLVARTLNAMHAEHSEGKER